MDKKELRKAIREKKRAMSAEEIELKSQALTEAFLRSAAYQSA